MKLFVGFLALFCALHTTRGYSVPSGGSVASSGAGSFASAGSGAQTGAQTGTLSGGATTYPGTGGNPSYGSQYGYTDNTISSTPLGGGTTGGGSYGGGSYGGASYGGASFGGANYGGSVGGGFGGGGGGAYAGTGAAPFVPPAGSFPPGPSQHDYQNLFVNFWKSLSDNYANAATMTYSTPGSKAFAAASSGRPNELINQQLAHQAALFNQINAAGSRFGAAEGGAVGGGGYYAPNFASSSASLGPQGGYQTANIIPANPNSPNVDTRYGDGGNPVVTMSAGPPGFYGVSSSSFSSSSDINGHVQSHREAQTSVNDNGKVTTYTVKS